MQARTAPAAVDAGVVRILLGFTRRYRWAVPLLILLSLVAALAEGFGIGLLIPLLDTILGDSSSVPSGPLADFTQRIAPQAARDDRVLIIAFGVLMLIAGKTVVLLANAALSTSINGRVVHELRVALGRQLLDVGYAYFAAQDRGRLLNTIETQTYRTSEALAFLVSMLASASMVAMTLVLLLLLSWQLTLVFVLLAAPVSYLVRIVTRRARGMGSATVKAYSDVAGRTLELLSTMRTVRIFNREQTEEQRFRQVSDTLRRLYVKVELVIAMLPPVVEFLYVPIFLVVVVYAQSRGIGVPSLLVFLVLLYRLQPHLKRLEQARVGLASSAAAVEEVAELLRRDNKPYLENGTRIFAGLGNRIEFDNVGFRYAGDGPAGVEGVTFAIERGDVVAIVGPSGAGKSTVVSLLCRFYDPQAGSIRVDGTPLHELEIASWRRRVGFAGQDAELVAGTIRDNIAYGTPGADATAVAAAARAAHAEGFILALPEGYDTVLGPRGEGLSGGERQRIALARAIARKPDLLILDEATNAIDNVTELAIQETVRDLARQCTILIVAHRMSTLRLASRVLVMSSGRIVEQGMPADVLRQDGLLTRLRALE